jgi:1-deoxy-D-xylulose-5-phosphate synthase
VIHDVCLQNLPVIFCLDRAGVVGADGPTHHGIFDIAFLRCIPNLILFAPRNEIELRNILYTAQKGLSHPIAIRYPRGRGKIVEWKQPFKNIEIGTATELRKGNNIAMLCIGPLCNTVLEAIDRFDERSQRECIGLYDMRFIKPLDETLLHQIFDAYSVIITVEDGVISGGFGSVIAEFASRHRYKNTLEFLGFDDEFPAQGNVEELHDLAGISVTRIHETLQKWM